MSGVISAMPVQLVAQLDRIGPIYGCGSVYLVRIALFAGGCIVAACVARALLRAGRTSTAHTLLFLLVFFILRFMLLDNPIAWNLYQRSLTHKDVGYREMNVIDLRAASFRDTFIKAGPDYLAVGSSQVGAIFSHWTGQKESVQVFSLAGMKPPDFFLYRYEIAAKRPRNLLLYLSELDMAQIPQSSVFQLSPPQGAGIVSALNTLRRAPLLKNRTETMASMVVKELLPEYYYAFVFRGMLKKALKPDISIKAEADSSEELQKSIEKFKAKLGREAIEANIFFLEEFIKFCEKRNLPVIIVEGHYNPLAVGDKTTELNSLVMARLRALTAQYSMVRIIPRSMQHQFSVADYRDITHVVPAAAREFNEHLSELLPSGAGTLIQR